jgi:peptidoglycan/xylan/chitin deacetylase (PgdA/CDA1 family)
VRRAGFILVVVAAVLVGWPAAGLASRPPRTPFAIASATLAQSGQQLVWTVQMRHPFSPAGLAGDHRSLCLALTSAGRQLCVTGPARGTRAPRLELLTGPAGRPRIVTATLTRPSHAGLTATFLPAVAGLPYRPLRWQTVSALTGRPCRGSSAPGCQARFPARPARLALHTPQLVGCLPAGPDEVFYGPPRSKLIALTFDDGPWSDTPQFLDELERAHAVATFFEIGDQVSEYGEHGAIERRMLADGDMIGDHTWNHADLATRPTATAGELTQAANAIRQATGGFQPCLFRPPYGAVTPAVVHTARSLGFLTIQWDIDPRDWALPGVAAIQSNVLANARPGAIVLQHDGGGDRSETLAALPGEIAGLRARGYRLVTVTDLLGLTLLYK